MKTKELKENKEISTTCYPVFGYGFSIKRSEYVDWMNDLVYDLIEMGKINPDKYENDGGYRVPYVPERDILKSLKIDPILDMYVLESECFNKYYAKDRFILWFNGNIFDESLSTLEKKNIILTVFHEMGMVDFVLDNIHTLLDIVEFEDIE